MPPLRRSLGLVAVICGSVGAITLLITLGAAKHLSASPLVLLYMLQLLALAGLCAGGVGLRVGAPWATAVFLGAAAGWVMGNVQYLLIFLNPLAVMSASGASAFATLLGVPILAGVAGLCARAERKA